MSEHGGSDTSFLPDLLVYFRPLTRQSLKAIKERMAEAAVKAAQEAAKKAEVSVSYNPGLIFKLNHKLA